MNRLFIGLLVALTMNSTHAQQSTPHIERVIEQLNHNEYQPAIEQLQQLLQDYQRSSTPLNANQRPVSTSAIFNQHTIAEQLILRVNQWQHAWQAKQVDTYLSYYTPSYTPKGMTHAQWRQQRQERLAQAGFIRLTLSQLKIELINEQHARVQFEQDYASDKLRNKTHKTLHLKLINQQWLITSETTS